MIPTVGQVYGEALRLDRERELAGRVATLADVLHLARALASLVHIFTDLTDAGGQDAKRRGEAQERIRIGLQAATKELELLNLEGGR